MQQQGQTQEVQGKSTDKLKLKKANVLTLEVIQADPSTLLKAGQKIVIKSSDVPPEGANLGKQSKNEAKPIVDFGGDKSVSKKLGHLIYKFDQFGISALPSSTQGILWQIPTDRRYQLNIDSLIYLDNVQKKILVQMTYPYTQVQGKDNAIFSTTMTELSEATIPLSSYAGKIDDMSKPQAIISVVDLKLNESKEYQLFGTNLETDKEFYLGEGGDVNVPGALKNAVKIGYSKDLKCWYIISEQTQQRCFLKLGTFYQNTKKLSSSYYRLADNMIFACGKNQQNVVKVNIN